MIGGSADDRYPSGVDLDRPSAARVYDALLGGSANFAVDRALARQMLTAEPNAGRWAQANRAFLRRAVDFLLDEGVRQFVDLGSGLPTVGNVHEIVHAADPDGRVVYVDVDPVAVAHGQSLLAGDGRAVVVQADIRDVDAILADPATQDLIDFDQPVGVLAVAVLHFVTDDPTPILAGFRSAAAPGSHLVVSHLTTPDEMSAAAIGVVAQYNTRTGTPLTFRSRAQVTDLFAGWRLLEPGVVPADTWWPEPGDLEEPGARPRVPIWAGVARLPYTA
ncbi:SAM-dependent methyltransferase [Polymorphospora rubra]|uniref:SAM-dependent methyltransferase n=1 Tax=Polymorphospora rubra TaxID=338584 RepID=UPI0033D74126